MMKVNMKKVLLLFALVSLVTSAKAQNSTMRVFKKSSVKMENGTLLAPRHDASLDETTVWGYYTGSFDGLISVGTSQAGTFSVAMKVPGEGVTEGASICGFKIPIFKATNMTNVSVFVTSALDGEYEMTKSIDKSALKNSSYVSVALDEEYAIPADGVYVGYTFTISQVLDLGDAKPIMTDGVSTAKEQLWVKAGIGPFQDCSSDGFGASALQVYLKNMNQNKYDVAPYGFDEVTVVLGEEASADVMLVNQGSEGITSFVYTVATDMADADFEKEITLPTPVKGFNAYTTVSLPLPTDAVTGQTLKTITITKVNGHENAAAEKSCEGKLTTLSKIVPKAVAVEELVGTGEGWSPRGYVGMEIMRETFGNQFVGLGLHQFNSSDAMYLAKNSYAQLAFTGSPSCLLNRTGDPIDPYHGTGDGICDDIRQALAVPAKAAVNITATLNEAKTKVDATATVESTFNNASFTVEFALVADQLSGTGSAWNQSNFYYQFTADQVGNDPFFTPFCSGGVYGQSIISDYKFNDVVIAGCYVDGSNPLPPLTNMKVSEPQEVNCTLMMPTKTTLKNAINYDKVYAVALVIDSEGHITNAAKVKVKNNPSETQSLTFNGLPVLNYGDDPYELPQTTEEGLPLTWEIVSEKAIAHIEGTKLFVDGAGNGTLVATQEGDDIYFPFTKEYNLTVEKAQLTITANSYTIIKGDEIPEFEYTINGFINNETIDVLISLPTIHCDATSDSPTGTYEITIDGAEAENYNPVYVSGTLVIKTDHGIAFADNLVKQICVNKWDTDKDGELSVEEAVSVTELGNTFQNSAITSFNELRKFSGLQTISTSAFQGCTELSQITLPEGINKIDNNAFAYCYSLQSVTIPEGVQAIGNRAFYRCGSLSSVNIPEGVTTIGNEAFTDCDFLTSLTIPSSMESIGQDAFSGCIGLTSVTMMCQNIGNWFCQSNSVREIILSDGVVSIGDSAFQDCTKLSLISIPESVTRIGDNSFSGCSSLQSIDLPDNVEYIGVNAFRDIEKIYVNRGSVSLINLWSSAPEKTPYEKITEKQLLAPKVDFDVTQTTVTMQITPYYPENSYSYNRFEMDMADSDEYIPIESDELFVSGLYPEYNENVILKVAKDNFSYQYRATYRTLDINPDVSAGKTMASSIEFLGTYEKGDAVVTNQMFVVNGQTAEGNTFTQNGLDPATSYDVTFSIVVSYGDNGEYSKTYECTKTYMTETLNFTTQPAKVIGKNDVIVSAASNLDDGEFNVGFEWRRTDTDESLFESNKGQAYLYEGIIEGYIRNLNENFLWKFRPYYTADSGNEYYGEWKGIDLSDDQSYFEPTVHTYATIDIEDGTATVSGYAQRGSDEIEEEGFLYWKESADTNETSLHAPAYSSIPDNAIQVTAEGTLMQAQLKGLRPETSYQYVAFIRTVKGDEFYGAVRSFTTGTFQIATDIETAVQCQPTEAIYDMSGRKHNKIQKGLNIIRMADGTTRKVVVK